MPDRPTSPRIHPLPADQRPPDVTALLDAAGAGATSGAPASNIFTTLARHPGLFRRWLPFGGKLLAGKLPARDRELLILRTGWRCRSAYEWGQHTFLAREAGISDEEVARVKDGPEAEGWTALEAALLRAADELHDDACITDATWVVLAEHYDERQLVEVPMVVGHYHLVAFTLSSLGVQREPGVPGFDG